MEQHVADRTVVVLLEPEDGPPESLPHPSSELIDSLHAQDVIIRSMKRTSLFLPPDPRNRAEHRARLLGLSLAEFVRRALADALDAGDAASQDPFFLDTAVHDGDAPVDASGRHDEHLYGSVRP